MKKFSDKNLLTQSSSILIIGISCFAFLIIAGILIWGIWFNKQKEENVPSGNKDVTLSVSQLNSLFGIDADEYSYNWYFGMDDSDINFEKVSPTINTPLAYFKTNTDGSTTMLDNWTLKNGYKLELSCPNIDIKNDVDGDSYQCSLSYNGVLVSNDVRFSVDGSNCAPAGLAYFEEFSMPEDNLDFLVVESGGGASSFGPIYMFKLDNGVVTPLPFDSKGQVSKTEDSDLGGFELYYKSNDSYYACYDSGSYKLVTYRYSQGENYKTDEPINMDLGVGLSGTYKVWDVNASELSLERTIGDAIKL